MEIHVQVRTVYGRPSIYPANDAARTLARIAGTETLTPHALRLAKELGHVVHEIVQPRLEEALAHG